MVHSLLQVHKPPGRQVFVYALPVASYDRNHSPSNTPDVAVDVAIVIPALLGIRTMNGVVAYR
jgi:hypothetical protein